MGNNKFKGLGVALVTPFSESGEIDFGCLEKLMDDVINNGVDYVVALGTTSESPTLKDKEKVEVVRTVVSAVGGRVPVVMGLGGPSTYEVIDRFKGWNFDGVDAILSVTPYYNRPSQEGLYAHYRTIAHYSPLPIILYNVRSRTSCNIEADTTLRLANDCKNIIAIKEASGNINQIMRIVKHKPDDFLVISGDDAITLPLLATGVDGLISVVANAFPKEISQMVHLGLDGRFDEARKIHLRMLDITQSCFKEGNPSGIKAMLSLQGKANNLLRLPLVRVSAELESQMRQLLNTFGEAR
ncbi:MAG: 4-hydroxy-tetrahydrodipicolinate synthase [Bacteroidales bacterium]|nr:4-hydroxy-tetrahydrodipicolinate synthase [Bacteroidales bacterium]